MKRAICPVAGRLLLLAASSYAASNNASRHPLIDALKRRDVKAFNTLMAQHADVNTALPDGSTPLSWAAFLDLRNRLKS